jgi:hypothetical protein
MASIISGSDNFNSSAAVGTRGQVFTSSGTFTVPAGVSAVKVTVVGGGGGGGTRTTTGISGGGGGGGIAIEYITGLTAGTNISVTVGAGGNAATTGGTSSFAEYCSATGGASSGTNSTAGGGGGTGSGGNINITGGTGGNGINGSGSGGALQIYSTGAGGGSLSSATDGYSWFVTDVCIITDSGFGGTAGTGYFGGVGGASQRRAGASFNLTGLNGTVYGNGGSGAYRVSGTQTGGLGSAGIVVVEW